MSAINNLTDLAELDEALDGSRQRPVWIFKHSLICPISTGAWNEYRRFVEEADSRAVDFALIEIQKARPVSTALAERTGVRHESPQAILVSDGRPLWHASHSSITARSLADATERI